MTRNRSEININISSIKNAKKRSVRKITFLEEKKNRKKK